MIVDASVAFKWMVREALSDAAEELVERDDLCAPSILLAEIGHGLSKRVRRGELLAEGLAERLERLPLLLTLEPSDPDIGPAWALAMELNHSFYDCLYLALANRFDDVLMSADEVFVRKCASSGMSNRVVLLGAG
jgi:predicted nucleic acid-binding protein